MNGSRLPEVELSNHWFHGDCLGCSLMELPRGTQAYRRDQSRLGVPVLTFIVRAVPVRETLRCGTSFRKGAISY